MLPRNRRLTREQDIVRVVRFGRRIITPYIVVYVKNPESKQSRTRIACVVGKKVHTSAVTRHRYQRWLRVLSREYSDASSDIYDMVWVAKPSIGKAPHLRVVRESLIHKIR